MHNCTCITDWHDIIIIIATIYKPSHRVKKLIGHGSTRSDPWPMWPIRFSWPIWPMTHDPSTHSLLWGTVLDWNTFMTTRLLRFNEKGALTSTALMLNSVSVCKAISMKLMSFAVSRTSHVLHWISFNCVILFYFYLWVWSSKCVCHFLIKKTLIDWFDWLKASSVNTLNRPKL